MRRFKPGQRVVFDPKGDQLIPDANVPEPGTIVTIKDYSPVFFNQYIVVGYELTLDGYRQHFPESYLHPLVETRQRIAYKLSAPCPQELLNPNQLIELEQPVRP